MFSLDPNGIKFWSKDGVVITHPHCHFGPFVDYGRWFNIKSLNSGILVTASVKDNVIYQNFENLEVEQKWSENINQSLKVDFKITAKKPNITVFGFSRFHVQVPTPVVEEYPSSGINAGGQFASMGLCNFFPSAAARVSRYAWLKGSDGFGIFVKLSRDVENIRHLLYWEPYGSGRYALHVILYYPLEVNKSFEFSVEFDRVIAPVFDVEPPVVYKKVTAPVIQVLRAMAEFQNTNNPFGFVNIKLSNLEEALSWLRPIARRARTARALGIIGWPWAYPIYFKQSTSGHDYPYNAWSVEEPVSSNLNQMRVLWNKEGGGYFGALYRPYYYLRELGLCGYRFGDETSSFQIKQDLDNDRHQLLYLDDFGFDNLCNNDTKSARSDVAVSLLKLMRRDLGNTGQWFVEHSSSWTLPLAGGYITVSKKNCSLSVDMDDWQWKALKAIYPGANWLIAMSPSGLWGSEVQCQRDVIDFAFSWKDCPLIQDWLFSDGVASYINEVLKLLIF